MSKTIVFFGSGPVAAESLRLLNQDFEIEAVVTKPQPAHHKEPFPVLTLAQEFGIHTLTASTQQELSDVFEKYTLKSDLGIIIDYGIILSHDVIERFELGIINSHFSLLPRWRGADPISFSILEGDHETGVSLMVIADRLDEGDLLTQRSITIAPNATSASLTADLVSLSHKLLVEIVPLYRAAKIQPYPQPDEKPTYSHKLSKTDGIIDWQKPAKQLEREIRAYLGWPRSRTQLGGLDIIITAAHVVSGSGNPGSLSIENQQLGIFCSKDMLVIDRLIPPGKKDMSAQSFLNGYNLSL
ncbi:MAG TPA: methionyl-tRNA formyltransferase [Candidatus Dormibacteraeota bacterium]|nr:methionyl-tRNA formyltransferase [Candidatus Dormibacteraeota bacterium]